MEGEKLTKLLRVAFTLAETRRRKLEELERAIQSFPGAETRRAEATKKRANLSSEINSSDAAAMDGLRHIISNFNGAIGSACGCERSALQLKLMKSSG
jgi:hypothetical protein